MSNISLYLLYYIYICVYNLIYNTDSVYICTVYKSLPSTVHSFTYFGSSKWNPAFHGSRTGWATLAKNQWGRSCGRVITAQLQQSYLIDAIHLDMGWDNMSKLMNENSVTVLFHINWLWFGSWDSSLVFGIFGIPFFGDIPGIFHLSYNSLVFGILPWHNSTNPENDFRTPAW